jgi:S-disulfanyl-L-cysteine oxidoreductase SoxD
MGRRSTGRGVAGLGVLFTAVWSFALLHAQGPAEDVPRIWSGVFTAAQAERGRATYGSQCAGCHSGDLSGGAGPALAGGAFMTKWESETAARLFRVTRDTMPRGNPGSLSDQTAIDLVAFVLASNGIPPGEAELAAAPEALEALAIVPRSGATRREIPNFSIVEVAGCLIPAADRVWTLTRATEPVAAKDVPPAPADLQGAAARAPGTGTIRLVSVLPFGPDAHTARRVYVKGIINRSSPEALLNVTALAPLDAPCAP